MKKKSVHKSVWIFILPNQKVVGGGKVQRKKGDGWSKEHNTSKWERSPPLSEEETRVFNTHHNQTSLRR